MTEHLPNTREAKPRVGQGGLVTVAYLKARLDEGGDQLGIFMPLILDVVPSLGRYFTAAEVQEAIARTHGVSMPQQTAGTLLGRATRRGLLIRDVGRFHINSAKKMPTANVANAKALVEESQLLLGRALLDFLRGRGVQCADEHVALGLLLQFLLEQQVSVILGVAPDDLPADLSRSETSDVAEFLRYVATSDPVLKDVLAGILEGLVLYRAAFLPDLADVSRRFNNLTVAFDSVLVRQALGYEGTAPRALMRETIELLAASSVRCVVFDKTVAEIQRLLRMFQDKLATTAGQKSLRPGPMVRHFLTERYSASDALEMSVLLDDEIRAAGLTVVRAPAHEAQFTSGEEKLAARLASRSTGDVNEPRIEHDVDCVAGVLTMRRGHRSNRIEDARVVFATVSPMVIRNTRTWWEEDERETGIPPIVHVRALANLAWLKRPKANPDFQLRDLVTLCAAAMRPSARTWNRFLAHLEDLHTSQRLTEDQVTAIIVSSLSDRLLRDAELDADDPDDVDSGTLDEVVDRVISQYSDEADERVRDADARATAAVESLRRQELGVDGKARRWSTTVGAVVYWLLVVLGVLASITLAISNIVQGGLILGLAGMFLIVLEISGLLGQLRALRIWIESRLYRRFRRLLGATELEPPQGDVIVNI